MDIRLFSSAGYNLWETECEEHTDLSLCIWDGTGTNDIKGDWVRTGIGTENSVSSFSGSNGLEVNSLGYSEVKFNTINNTQLNIIEYNILSFWFNIKHWDILGTVSVSIYNNNNGTGRYVDISRYVNKNKLNSWQKLIINTMSFGIDVESPNVNELIFRFNGSFNVYIDNIFAVVGSTHNLPVGTPIVNTRYDDDDVPVISPSISTRYVNNTPQRGGN